MAVELEVGWVCRRREAQTAAAAAVEVCGVRWQRGGVVRESEVEWGIGLGQASFIVKGPSPSAVLAPVLSLTLSCLGAGSASPLWQHRRYPGRSSNNAHLSTSNLSYPLPLPLPRPSPSPWVPQIESANHAHRPITSTSHKRHSIAISVYVESSSIARICICLCEYVMRSRLRQLNHKMNRSRGLAGGQLPNTHNSELISGRNQLCVLDAQMPEGGSHEHGLSGHATYILPAEIVRIRTVRTLTRGHRFQATQSSSLDAQRQKACFGRTYERTRTSNFITPPNWQSTPSR